MKLSSHLVGLAVIASSFIAVNTVEAQSKNGWYKSGCNVQGQCNYVKKIGGSWPFIKYKLNSQVGMFTLEADCQQWKRRTIRSDGSRGTWRDVMPDSIGEGGMIVLCH